MHSKYVGVGVGISMGLCFGATLGAVAQNVSVGVAFGVGLGVAFAMVFGAGADSDATLARKKAFADKPLPHPLGLFERITTHAAGNR